MAVSCCNLHRISDSIKNAWDALRWIALKHVLDVGSKEPWNTFWIVLMNNVMFFSPPEANGIIEAFASRGVDVSLVVQIVSHIG